MTIATAVAVASCDDDRDSNPVIETPTEFTINTPSVGDAVVDLTKSESVNLTWSQPQFTSMNAPVVAHYQIQVSPDGTFNKAYDAAADDNTGADYASIEETYTQCSVDIPSNDIAKAMMRVKGWEEDAMPALVNAKIRVRAFVENASQEVVSEVTSTNTVNLNCVPKYVILKDTDPIMWYLVGNMFGGKWGSTIGTDALPMFMVPDYDYDKKTGAGEIEYTNYFTTGDYNDNNEVDGSGFKIQPADFNWDNGMTGNGTKGEIVFRNGGKDGGHIVAPEAGVYTIKMNTEKNTATMTKYEGDVAQYGTIQIAGSFNDWTDTPMLPYNTADVENHAWYYVMTVTEDLCQFKFKIAGSRDTNWGNGTEKAKDGDVKMYGLGKAGGVNLGLKKGKYVISFNDITGAYSIVELAEK